MSARQASQIILRSPLLAQPQGAPRRETAENSCAVRLSIRPQAILEVVRRRGRSWGLLAQYEESRLWSSRKAV